MIGLSNGDSHQNYNDIDFAFYPAIGGTLYIYEGGISRGTFGTYATGDVLRVAVEGGVVKYRKNGTLLYTSTVSPTYPLLVDTSLYSNGATLNNVVISGAAGGGGGSSTQIRWLVADHLGTPRMIFDQTGSLTSMSRHDYLPFGEELFAGTGGRTVGQGYTSSDNVRQKFTQKERDNETGLDYLVARYYSSTQGRFTGIDPAPIKKRHLINPQDFNRYSYVANHPLGFIDPDGEEKVRVVIETFIPAVDVTVTGRTFKGDFDNKGNRIEGSYRTQQVIVVETDSSKNGGNVLYERTRDTGRTYELDKPGGKPIADEKASGETLEAEVSRDKLGVHIRASGNESNPLITSPGITGEYSVHLQSAGTDGKLRVGFTAEHDPYPAHRITVTREESGNSTKQVYLFDPRTKGYTPWSLNPLQTNERRAGVIFIEPK